MTLMDKEPSLSCQDGSLRFLLLLLGVIMPCYRTCGQIWSETLLQLIESSRVPAGSRCVCPCARWPFGGRSQGCPDGITCLLQLPLLTRSNFLLALCGSARR